METKQENKTMITFTIEKNDWGFYSTTIYQDGKMMGVIYTDNKTQARKATSSQKKLQEQVKICQVLS